MKNMLRIFLSFWIAFSLIGTNAGQTFAQTAKHSISSDIVEITICAAGQQTKTILIDQNGNQVPTPDKCDCLACPNCINSTFFSLPDAIRTIGHEHAVILTDIPQSFDIADATTRAPGSARAPPQKV
ncbi:hypothetical protein ACFOY8_00045 [Thalassospira xianhensis]|uniref:Uncharacterized protein n=1 Tax=Thalassospira xianhensis MCCC 1A02616 TaxID=1177929 RepID=A0A367U9S9_9PROT|nr:hypothetical protein [Thalassospira xianhensis]RCK03792.1 hypothetical protein TH5_23375 [Thalassospira xianhensis MCCC 1A02616]UKV13022.1 hypothetical protein L6172_13270 [Thalassospiraceae bacterium SW-3-3]